MGQHELSPLSPASDGYKGCNRYFLDSGVVSSEFGNMACSQARILVLSVRHGSAVQLLSSGPPAVRPKLPLPVLVLG